MDELVQISSAAKTLQCPICSKPVACFDPANSRYFVCRACNTYFTGNEDGSATVLRHWADDAFNDGLLSPGASAVFKGVQYTVTGMLVKQDRPEKYIWREYLLFNPAYENYHVLAEFLGNWILIKKVDGDYIDLVQPISSTYDTPQEYIAREFRHMLEGTKVLAGDPVLYHHYVSYTFDILYAWGEFDWNILEDEGMLDVHEYIAPPYMLANEVNENGYEWYKGELLEQNEVVKGLNVKRRWLPRRLEKSALRVPFFERTWEPIARFSLLYGLLLLLTLLFVSYFRSERKVTAFDFELSDSTGWNASGEVSREFSISGPTSVEIDLSTNLQNTWLETEISMTNLLTGNIYGCTKVLEHYSGYDGGERWEEGSNNEIARFSGVPTGKYKLNIYTSRDAKERLPVHVNIFENAEMNGSVYFLLTLTGSVFFIYLVILASRNNNQ